MSQPVVKTFLKDPGEQLDFSIDYAARLDIGEVITSSVWAISGPDSALVKLTDMINDPATSTKIYVNAGTDGDRYFATNTASTNSSPPRTFVETIAILVMGAP